MAFNMHRSVRWMLLGILLSGCAGIEPTPLTAKHPASSQAAEGVIFRPAPLADETTQQVTEQLARDKPEQEFAERPSSEHGAAGMEHGHKTHQPEAGDAAYACPMHPEVTSAQPGKCPKCGMDLVRRGTSPSQQ